MSLAEITVDHLRCLRHAELSLHPGHNLIWGPNGSGKTSLLEAIYLLGRGRSFRTRNTEKLIRHGESSLTVFGRTDTTPAHTLGVQASPSGGTVAKIDGTFVQSLAELSSVFAVQVIEPGAHKLVEEGGHGRRRWLDWTVFHVEPNFVEAWTRYTRAVKQRNAALRTAPAEASAWDGELVKWGERVSEARRSLLARLQPHWQPLVTDLAGFRVDLTYFRGWSADHSLADALRSAWERDRARGLTHVGPHRADVLIRVGGKVAREVLSRGQQKLVAAAMSLAQLKLLAELGADPPTLLLDDPAAELDAARLERFIAQVASLRCQLVVTALHPDSDRWGRPERAFHVEQGEVRPV